MSAGNVLLDARHARVLMSPREGDVGKCVPPLQYCIRLERDPERDPEGDLYRENCPITDPRHRTSSPGAATKAIPRSLIFTSPHRVASRHLANITYFNFTLFYFC